MKPYVGDLSILGVNQLKLARRSMRPDEQVRFCLRAPVGQALVALDERLLIVKAEFLAAVRRSRVVSVEYLDVAGVEFNQKLTSGTIDIHVATRSGDRREKMAYSFQVGRPFKIYQPMVRQLRELSVAAKLGTLHDHPVQNDAAAELVQKLTELHHAGVLTDLEFIAAMHRTYAAETP
jgi:hypothetical protein